MSNQSLGTKVQDSLEQAVKSGLLSKDVQIQAEQLLDRLKTPVRLSLLGMPGSGKSTLLNLLVGAEVVPEGARLPTLNLTYGPEEQAICTLADGSKKTFPTANAHAIAALSPVFVEMRLPLAALKKISVLEIVAPNDPTAIHRASQWAAKRTDIALWCTGGYDEVEQRIWSQMPDMIKDHAFLMLTRVELLQSQGIFDEMLSAVKSNATGEFDRVLPIATRKALNSRKADGSVDKDMMRESGGLALISGVLKQVELGRQSTIDQADVLLLQNADALADIDEQIAAPEAAVEAAPAPETKPQQAPAPDTYQRPKSKVPPMPKPAPRKEPAPEELGSEGVTAGIAKLRTIAARRAEEMVSPPPASALQPATRAAYQHVIERLHESATELVKTLEELGEDAPSQVISVAVEDMQWLCDYLSENGDESDASLQRARDTAFDAADLVQLMQMEKRDSAALEAVSIMLQLKRELQADMAA